MGWQARWLDGSLGGWVFGCLSVIWAEQRTEAEGEGEAVVSVGRITVTVKLLPYCDKQTTTARTTTRTRMRRMETARTGIARTNEWV